MDDIKNYTKYKSSLINNKFLDIIFSLPFDPNCKNFAKIDFIYEINKALKNNNMEFPNTNTKLYLTTEEINDFLIYIVIFDKLIESDLYPTYIKKDLLVFD